MKPESTSVQDNPATAKIDTILCGCSGFGQNFVQKVLAWKPRGPGFAPQRHAAWGDHAIDPGLVDHIDARPQVRRAAVLFGMMPCADGLSLLLTQRSAALKDHPGQIALPGGKIEPGESVQAAAYREAKEEIDLDPSDITSLRDLPPYETGSGFSVGLHLALIDPHAVLKPSPDEVDEIFFVNLASLFDENNHIFESLIWRGEPRRYVRIRHPERKIWGVTSGILRLVYEEFYGT